MKIGIIGMGFMGSCIAKNIKESNIDQEIIGIDNNYNHLEQAKSFKFIDTSRTSIKDIHGIDTIIISLPVDVILRTISSILDVLTQEQVIFDIGSTKASVCKLLSSHSKREQYVATHPIAGGVGSNPVEAYHSEDIFNSKTIIICEPEKSSLKSLRRVKLIFRTLRMNIVYLDPSKHDKYMAYISHLPSILSNIIVNNLITYRDTKIRDFIGPGFSSMGKLSKSPPSTFMPIFIDNKDNIQQCIDNSIESLTTIKRLLSGSNEEKLRKFLQENNKFIKEILN